MVQQVAHRHVAPLRKALVELGLRAMSAPAESVSRDTPPPRAASVEVALATTMVQGSPYFGQRRVIFGVGVPRMVTQSTESFPVKVR